MGESIGRYRKCYPRIWRHEGFRALSKSGRELALYLLTGPQTSPIGLFHFSVATAAEDLDVAVETVRKGLPNVCTTFGWHFDAAARVFYIPSWWRWNPPENANVLKGNLKALNEIPPSGLVYAFIQNLGTLPETLQQTFIEACRIRIPERSRIQEQEQRSGSGKQEQEGARRNQSANAPRRLTAEEQKSKGADERLLKVAREVIQVTGPNRPLDELVDAFQSRVSTLHPSTTCSRSTAIVVLHQALAARDVRVTA